MTAGERRALGGVATWRESAHVSRVKIKKVVIISVIILCGRANVSMMKRKYRPNKPIWKLLRTLWLAHGSVENRKEK